MPTTITLPPAKIVRIPVEGIAGAFILLSARHHPENPDRVPEPIVSFFFDAGQTGAEWCPPFGPIQLWYKTDQEGEGTRTHYFYGRVENRPMAWSQMAVEHEGLPEALECGDVQWIFAVLKRWARRDEPSADDDV